MTATRHHGTVTEEGLSPVCSKPVMVSTPPDPFLLRLPGTTFSDRVYWTAEKKVVIGSRSLSTFVASRREEVEGDTKKRETREGREERRGRGDKGKRRKGREERRMKKEEE